ncbi:uncharacterized protein LOC127862822 [Dreissena polymorpha]|nr:uncharacterized protein LOC127862822 [Dreissena polymorpha]
MKECVFHFEITYRLTMMNDTILVYPYNGSLYAYNVTDPSVAEPVPPDNVITGDGWENPRLVTVVNGKLPGPDIIVYEGQDVVVHVKNGMRSEGTTIHWHGLPQVGTPWMDGVPYVTQCPILPGQSFTYRFKAEPKGTFWWHSHVGTQRSNGLFGAFIIKERTETSTEDLILQINDWNHDMYSDMEIIKDKYRGYDGRIPWPTKRSLDNSGLHISPIHAGLINGRGRYYDTNGTDNGAPLTIFNVMLGTKYRFRVIGTSSTNSFRVSVDGHTLTVVASDGYDLDPVDVESFVINPGERFDFEIMANQPVGNYWIRGITLEKGQNHRADAILHYINAPASQPQTSRQLCTATKPCTVLNCPFTYYPENYTECVKLDKLKSAPSGKPAPIFEPGRSKEYFLNFGFPPSVNGRSFDTPDVNPLLQPKEWSSPCTSPQCGDDHLCKCTHALEIGNNDTVQIVFFNMGRGKGASHPIHMHGHSFYVLKMGYGQYNSTTAEIIGDNPDINCTGPGKDSKKSFCTNATWRNSSWLNGNVPNIELNHPLQKDTIIVPTGGYVVLRIKADNPGLWNMHCHIEPHLLGGMQMLINESFADIPKAPDWIPDCFSYPASPYRMGLIKNCQTNQSNQNDALPVGQVTTENHPGLLIAILVMQIIMMLVVSFACFRQRNYSTCAVCKGHDEPGISLEQQ